MADATRTCAACRRQLDRDDALRIVLGPAGQLVIDFGRKLPGRGANACWSPDCLSGLRDRGTRSRTRGYSPVTTRYARYRPRCPKPVLSS